MRPTRVEIDLSSIKHNIELIKARTKGRIMMAIKADAYGHGAATVGQYVQEKNLVDMLGVSCLEEGVQLRNAGVVLPILDFGLVTTSQEDIDAVFSHNLTPTLVDMSQVDALVQGARRWNRSIAVHIKTDTGMGRLGLTPEKTLVVIEQIASLPEITITGIYTHFPVSDIPGSAFTESQIRQFIEFSNKLASMKIDVGLRHCANSGAIINHRESFMDMVRPGILCYGLYPGSDMPKELELRPAMTLKTGIMFMKRVKKGTGLSYGLTYRPERDTNIATIPIGYADGYPRTLSNTAKVLIAGKQYPVAGRICMDQTLIDLGEDTYPVGQEVIMFGPDTITASTVASWCSTIPYEVTCDMSRRVPRRYSNTQDAA